VGFKDATASLLQLEAAAAASAVGAAAAAAAAQEEAEEEDMPKWQNAKATHMSQL